LRGSVRKASHSEQRFVSTAFTAQSADNHRVGQVRLSVRGFSVAWRTTASKIAALVGDRDRQITHQ
jgi:hypothetical protein